MVCSFLTREIEGQSLSGTSSTGHDTKPAGVQEVFGQYSQIYGLIFESYYAEPGAGLYYPFRFLPIYDILWFYMTFTFKLELLQKQSKALYIQVKFVWKTNFSTIFYINDLLGMQFCQKIDDVN